jgi:hypothetical protein
MKLRKTFAALTLGFAVPAVAHADYDVTSELYICERGAVVPVTYITADSQPVIAVAVIEGRQIPMFHRTLTGGPVYVAANEQESYRWAPDGDGATLTFLAADDSAKEQTILSQCRRQEQPAE